MTPEDRADFWRRVDSIPIGTHRVMLEAAGILGGRREMKRFVAMRIAAAGSTDRTDGCRYVESGDPDHPGPCVASQSVGGLILACARALRAETDPAVRLEIEDSIRPARILEATITNPQFDPPKILSKTYFLI